CRPQAEGTAMLRPVAEGVLIHQSEFCQSNAVVVPGQAGVLLIDAGIYGSEMACLANDLSDAGQTVVAGFSTHPPWDHVLWHARFGSRPAARLISEISCRVRTGRTASPSGYRRTSPSKYRGTCLASLPACPPKLRGFPGMALKSGLSSIRRMPRAMRRC